VNAHVENEGLAAPDGTIVQQAQIDRVQALSYYYPKTLRANPVIFNRTAIS
jgi:hypothetical protein